MSYETRSLTNFSGFDELRAEFEAFQLEITELSGDQHILGNRDRIELFPPAIREIGIRHLWPCNREKLDKAIEKTTFEAAEIELVIIAENRKMKLREVMFASNLEDSNQFSSIEVVSPAVARSKTLMSRRDGFDLKAFLVLGSEQQPRPLKPYRQGAILASVSFEIRPTKLGSGIRPRPLTQEVVLLHGLISNTVLFVDQKNEFASTSNLDDAVAIYVDEEILKIIGTSRSWESKGIQRQLVIESLQQIVFLFSLELKGLGDENEYLESAVLDVIENQLNSLMPKKNRLSRLEIATRIRDNPGVVASMISNLDSHRKTLIRFVIGDGE